MLLLSLLVETGQLPGTGLTQAEKNMYTIKLLFGDSQGGAPGFQGGEKAPPAPPPPKCNPDNTYLVT